jgi:hypothetical protein
MSKSCLAETGRNTNSFATELAAGRLSIFQPHTRMNCAIYPLTMTSGIMEWDSRRLSLWCIRISVYDWYGRVRDNIVSNFQLPTSDRGVVERSRHFRWPITLWCCGGYDDVSALRCLVVQRSMVNLSPEDKLYNVIRVVRDNRLSQDVDGKTTDRNLQVSSFFVETS